MSGNESMGTQAIQILKEKNLKRMVAEIEKSNPQVIFDAKDHKRTVVYGRR